jgi:DNA-binding winged helix-turn-helix (wHTH) protein/tetratricopeptide (TPR) repeat protein
MSSPVYRFGACRLDPTKRELARDDAIVDVPPRVFACLLYLVEQRERAVDRAELIRAVWRRDNVSDTQLFQLVLRARRAVGDDADNPHAIRTIVGFGYRWIAPTTVETPEAEPGIEPVRTEPALTEPTPPPQPPRRRPLAWGIAAALVLALLAFAWLRTPPAEQAPPAAVAETARIAVVPLNIEANAQSDAAWVRYGGMDLVADRLRRSGLVVQTSEATLGAVMAAGEAAPGDALRRAGTIGLVVGGDVARRDGAWHVTLRAERPGANALRGDAADADLMRALRAAGDALLPALGRGAPTDAIDAPVAQLLSQARAAMLADDAKAAKAAIEAAAPGLRDDPEVRLMRAQIDARLGRFADAQNAITALLADANASDAYLRMRALIVRGAAYIPLGDADRARADFDAALAVPGAERYAHARGDAYAGRGATGTMRNDFSAAANDLGQARVLLDQSGDALGVARVDLEWALLDHARGAAEPAATRFAQAARQFEALAAKRPLKSALIGLEDVQYDQLQTAAAMATSDRAWATLAAGGDPLLRRVMSIQRVKILIATGRLREVHDVLAAIESGNLDYLAESHDDTRLRLARTELAWREGRPDDAAREAQLLPNGRWPDGSEDVLAAKASLWRQRVLPDSALPAAALPPATHDAPGVRHAAPYRALAEAERLVRVDRVADAERQYQEALRLADETGGPLVLTTIAASYVPVLIGDGRTRDAATLAARIAVWASDDYEAALIQLRVAHALGERTAWQSALDNVRRLAGERRVPAELEKTPPERAAPEQARH